MARDWRGARWWKFDFHTHTPASEDYGSGADQERDRRISPREWLLEFMARQMDCVAVTDHNTGEWVDGLNDALEELRNERPDGYWPLTLFPGVELSVTGGIHVLALLEPGSRTADVHELLGAVEIEGRYGSGDACSRKSLPQAVDAVVARGAIPIPAHIDGPRGLFEELQGQTLLQALKSKIAAAELLSTETPLPELYVQAKCDWAMVLGSDSHHPADRSKIGQAFTWVKMEEPALQGLRLALLDGDLSIQRSDECEEDPNAHAAKMIERIEVVDARYVGRQAPFVVRLNPWLTAVIGGRGTGKSSLIEFLRLPLEREGEIPRRLRPEFTKYWSAYADRDEPGLLTADTVIRCVYVKDQTRFRLSWRGTYESPRIERETNAGAWEESEGDVRTRFPVRIHSQRQIFELAKDPSALLSLIDEAQEVGRSAWAQGWKERVAQFLALRAQARGLSTEIEEAAKLRGELEDLKRKLGVFEDADHANILEEYQLRVSQERDVEGWIGEWDTSVSRLRRLAESLETSPLEFDRAEGDEPVEQSQDEEDAAALPADAADDALERLSADAQHRREEFLNAVRALADRGSGEIEAFKAALDTSPWREAVTSAKIQYQDLVDALQGEETSPSEYADLVNRLKDTQAKLEEIEALDHQLGELKDAAAGQLDELRELRRTITSRRSAFLREVLAGNQHIRIEVRPYGARSSSERSLRGLLGREEGGFDRDIGAPDGGGLLGGLFAGNQDAAAYEERLDELRSKLIRFAGFDFEDDEVGDRRFVNHMAGLPPEAADRIELWAPDDTLDVQYSPSGDGRNWRAISEGSPGQRTAALLAFLLAYGDEPIVLDQPEDDLDNRLVYRLIVGALRSIKQSRQIVVVTHNANIVVNGDAELVIALEVLGGETREAQGGSLQSQDVRDMICELMEGGRDAFQKRYRRISLDV